VTLQAVLWRTSGDEAGGPSEMDRHSIPAVIRSSTWSHHAAVSDERPQPAGATWRQTLPGSIGIYETLAVFDRYGKMSQFSNLWRIFTCRSFATVAGGRITSDRNLLYADSLRR